MIEVLEVINVDWWHGRHRGREGHFPSSFVERLTNDAARHPVPPPPNPSYASMPPHVLSPFTPYPTQPYYAPPPAPYPPYNRPPPLPGPAPVVAHSNPPNNKKPGPHGSGLGNTVRILFYSFPCFVTGFNSARTLCCWWGRLRGRYVCFSTIPHESRFKHFFLGSSLSSNFTNNLF